MKTQRILMPGEIEALGSAVPVDLILPEREALFRDRAARLRQLAPENPMRGYLLLCAAIADVQHTLLAEALSAAAAPVPDDVQLARAREFSMPPLAVASWSRHASWRALARSLAERLLKHTDAGALPDAARQSISQLVTAQDDWLEQQANEILNGLDVHLDRGLAPLVAAALQVYWSSMVIGLGLPAFSRLEHQAVCPCCGSRPTASIVRMGSQSGQRYLHCALCAAQWHLVRIKCSQCDSTEGIEYLHIEDRYPAVRAECCPGCGSYLKIVYSDKDPLVEPQADDLGSLALDLMLSETTDKARAGLNLALFQGEG